MRTQRFFSIVLTLVLACTFSNQLTASEAEHPMIVRINQMNAEMIQVQLANIQKVRTNIQIIGMDGKEWYSETTNGKHGYHQQFDVSEIPSGNYILRIKNKSVQHFKVFQKTERAIAFFENTDSARPRNKYARLVGANNRQVNRMIANVKTIGSRKVDVQLANLLEQPTSIALKTLGGTQMIELKTNNQTSWEKLFNLEGMSTGAYYLVIRNGNKTIMRFLSVTEKGISLSSAQSL